MQEKRNGLSCISFPLFYRKGDPQADACAAAKIAMAGDGIVKKGVDNTIRTVGRMARPGMRETDREILDSMTGSTSPADPRRHSTGR